MRKKVVAIIDWLSSASARLAGWLCFALVLLTVQQVVARYLFDASSVALQELQWHLFGAVFLLGTAQALKEDVHVRVDFLASRFPPRVLLAIEILGALLLLIPVCLLVVWYGYSFAVAALEFTNPHPADYWSESLKGSFAYKPLSTLESLLRSSVLIGEISPDPGGLEARWIVKMLIPVGFVLLLFQALLKLARDIQSFMRKA